MTDRKGRAIAALRALDAMVARAFDPENVEKGYLLVGDQALLKVMEEAGELAATHNKHEDFERSYLEAGDLLWSTAMYFTDRTHREYGMPAVTHAVTQSKETYAILLYALVVRTHTMSTKEILEALTVVQKWIPWGSKLTPLLNSVAAAIRVYRSDYPQQEEVP